MTCWRIQIEFTAGDREMPVITFKDKNTDSTAPNEIREFLYGSSSESKSKVYTLTIPKMHRRSRRDVALRDLEEEIERWKKNQSV